MNCREGWKGWKGAQLGVWIRPKEPEARLGGSWEKGFVDRLDSLGFGVRRRLGRSMCYVTELCRPAGLGIE